MKKKFTLFTVAALSLFALGACSTTTPTKKEASQVSSSAAEANASTDAAKSTDYKVGDTIVFDGHMEITIMGVEWTEERNQFADTQPERVLKVTYNIKNLSDEDYVVGNDMELYVAGNKMETYPNSSTFETISKGRNFEGAVQHFGVNGSGDMELEVEPSFAFDTEPAIIKLDIQ